MLMRSATGQVEIFDVKVSDTEGSFHLETKLTKVEKPCLLELPNPHYDQSNKDVPSSSE